MQSLVFSASQRQYTKAARTGLQAAGLALKDAREQVALDVSTAYIEMDTRRKRARRRAAAGGPRHTPCKYRNRKGAQWSRRRLQHLISYRPVSPEPNSDSSVSISRPSAATLAKQISVLTGHACRLNLLPTTQASPRFRNHRRSIPLDRLLASTRHPHWLNPNSSRRTVINSPPTISRSDLALSITTTQTNSTATPPTTKTSRPTTSAWPPNPVPVLRSRTPLLSETIRGRGSSLQS